MGTGGTPSRPREPAPATQRREEAVKREQLDARREGGGEIKDRGCRGHLLACLVLGRVLPLRPRGWALEHHLP